MARNVLNARFSFARNFILAENNRLRSSPLLQAATRCVTYFNPRFGRKLYLKMTKQKTIIILIICLFIFLAFIPKKINVIYQNSIETKVLNVKLFLDGKEIENNEIVYSYPFPKKSSRLSVNSGYHTIEIKCSELKIEKSVKVFTPFKNNIEFEFIGNAENGFDVIERNSWFDLVYE